MNRNEYEAWFFKFLESYSVRKPFLFFQIVVNTKAGFADRIGKTRLIVNV